MMATLGGYFRAAVTWCWNGGARDALIALDQYLRVAFLWFWVGVGILLAIYSYDGYGTGLAAFMLGSVFFIYAVRRLYRAFKASKVRLPDFAFIIYAVVVFVVGVHGSSSSIQAHETNFAPLLAALEQYRNTTGEYPDEAAELVPEYVASLPKCPVSGGWAPDLFTTSDNWVTACREPISSSVSWACSYFLSTRYTNRKTRSGCIPTRAARTNRPHVPGRSRRG